MKKLKIAFLGFGNAGQGFAKLLSGKLSEIQTRYDTEIQTVAIVTGSRGSLLNPNGIDLPDVCAQLENHGSFDHDSRWFSWASSVEVAKNADYDVLIELTPLDIFTGQPSITHIKTALQRKKHAITANKGPLAWAYRELRDLADSQKVQFLYETAVMDGTPVFNLKEETLKFCRVTKIAGILNSTTNFILNELANGKEYAQILTEGKARGFIEADESLDIDGWDAAAKLAALLNVFMDGGITPLQIDRTGIQSISMEDIKSAERRGEKIKLVCRGFMCEGTAVGTVKPESLNRSDLYSAVDGTSSVLSITTDLMGTVSIVEHAPEIAQTAYGIFSDLIRIIEKTTVSYPPKVTS